MIGSSTMKSACNMEYAIYLLSVALALYWTATWFRFRHLTLGHDAQIVCAIMLWGVVIYFHESPEVSKYHMLWAVPVAFFGSSLVSQPYMRFRLWLRGLKENSDQQ